MDRTVKLCCEVRVQNSGKIVNTSFRLFIVAWVLLCTYFPLEMYLFADLQNEISIHDLFERIAAAVGVPVDHLEILTGFPPKPLGDVEDTSTPAFDALKLSNNDLMTVKERKDVAAPMAADDKDAGFNPVPPFSEGSYKSQGGVSMVSEGF